LVKQDLTPIGLDLFLFLSSTLMLTIFFFMATARNKIDDFIAQMKTEDVALNKEGTAEG
jgi:hypothetical protein